jgi:hypothetical protein
MSRDFLFSFQPLHSLHASRGASALFFRYEMCVRMSSAAVAQPKRS